MIELGATWSADPANPARITMSDGLVARMAAAERQEDLQAERQERERQHRAERNFEEALMFRARQVASERGTQPENGDAPGGLRPHAPESSCWEASERMDIEDRRRQAEEAAQIRRLLIREGYVDDSANKPTEFQAELALEVASRDSALGLGEEFLSKRELAAAGQGLRTRFLRRQARGQL